MVISSWLCCKFLPSHPLRFVDVGFSLFLLFSPSDPLIAISIQWQLGLARVIMIVDGGTLEGKRWRSSSNLVPSLTRLLTKNDVINSDG